METNTMETAMDVTSSTAATNPAHEGMVDYLASVMRHNQQAGRSAYDTIRVMNRQEAQLAASPDDNALEQHATYASMIGADVNDAVTTVIACAEPQKGRNHFAELHCEALDKLNTLEQRDNRHADREYHVIRAAALAHYAAEHYLACKQYLTQYGIDTILETQELSERETSAARALFQLFQREKIPAIAADKEQYHARAMKMPEHAAHAAGD